MSRPTALDRRVLVRQRSRQTLCLSEADTKEEILWVARIQDVCHEGVRLLLMRRFDPGTLLRLEIPGQSQDKPLLIQARVIHVLPYPNGSFGLGCRCASAIGALDRSLFIPPMAPFERRNVAHRQKEREAMTSFKNFLLRSCTEAR